MTEAEISKSVRKRLEFYQSIGDVLWHSRLQSLKIQHNGHWIQGCKPGTPDYIAIIRDKKLNLLVLFFEIKSEKGKLRIEQKKFANYYNSIKNMWVFTIREPKIIDEIINNLAFDRTTLLPNTI